MFAQKEEIPTLVTEAAEKPQLATALAAFQAEMPRVVKASTAKITGREGRSGYSYDYAELSAVVEAVMPLLAKHGLAFLAKPTWLRLGDALHFVLVYKLMHESGQQEVGFWPLPDPARAASQDLGSAITYARRYSFQAVTGVAPAPGEDDDGAAAGDAPRPETPDLGPPMIDNSQRRQIGQRLTDLGIEDDGEIRLAWLTGITGQHVESLDQLTRYEAEALLNELRPVTKSMRTDLIALLGSVGLTEQDEVMNRLRDWTGRGVAGTADLARFEYASIKRKVAEVKHDREQSDQAGEPEQRTLDDDG